MNHANPSNPAVCQLCLSHKTGTNSRDLGICPLCSREIDVCITDEKEKAYRRGTLIESQARRVACWQAAVEKMEVGDGPLP